MKLEERQLIEGWVERESVIWREAMFEDSEFVFTGWVTFVAVPPVIRELRVKLVHFVVAESFREDGSGGDRGIGSVAVYDAFERDVEIGEEAVAVD